MRFLTFLKSGGSVRAAAATECAELIQRSYDAGHLCLEMAAEFISECMRAIGFTGGVITVQQLAEDAGPIEWPKEADIYIFRYSSLLFTPFELFLVQLFASVEEQQQMHMAALQLAREETASTTASAAELDDVVSPLDWWMELVGQWCRVYRQLAVRSSHFVEPLARINYHMLLGMHRLRLRYRADEYQLLDEICNRLSRSAWQGLYYRQTHQMIARGVMDMFESNCDLFYQHQPGFLNFYFELLSVVHQKVSYRHAFKSLQKLLQLPAAVPQTILIEFLIETRMQEVYYTTLKFEKSKQLLLAALEFLNVLQRKLLDVECLAKGLISHILLMVLNADASISSLAAELYINIMRRRFADDKFILEQILEFVLLCMSTPTPLPHYVHTLWPHFAYMQTIDVYLEIIRNVNTAACRRFICAHFLNAVYQEMLQNIGKYQHEVEHMLKLLPEVLTEMTRRCNTTGGILLDIFRLSDLELLKLQLPAFMSLIAEFEKYAVQDFTHASHYEYPLLVNLYGELNRCLRHTDNWHRLERSAAEVGRVYFEIEKKLTQLPLDQQQPSDALIREYRVVLQKIGLLLKFDHNLIGSFTKLFSTLKARLIDTPQIYELIQENNYFLDVYAVGILTLGIVKFATNADFSADETEAEKLRVISVARELAQHLGKNLRKMSKLSELPAMRIAVTFNNLVDLYCALPAKSNVCPLPLTANGYHLLIETLLQLNFSQDSPKEATYRPLKLDDGGDEVTQQHPQWIQDNQRLMLRKFTQLHECAQIEIPTKLSWKLCIYYGLPKHDFSAELGQLLRILGAHHFAIYKHICGVLVFNLYKRQPALTDRAILAAVKAHNTLIDDANANASADAKNGALLKVHLVLSVLTIVEKSVEVTRIFADKNRLLALKHLHVFLERLNLSQDNVLPLIIEQTNALRKYRLNFAETRQLNLFLNFCKQYQK